MLYRELFIKILKYKRFAKFFISGSISALVNIFSLFVLHGVFAMQVVLAASISFVLAFLVNFSLQKFWTFASSSKKRIRKQMLQHFSVGVLALGINALGMYLLVEVLFVWYILAQVILALILAFFNYFLYKIIFLDKNKNSQLIGNKKEIKKILIATGIYPPDSGGPATYSKILQDEFVDFGYEIKVVSYGEQEDGDELNNIYRISRKQNVLARYIKYFYQVKKLAKWADIVYAQGPVSEGLPSYFACRLARRKYILKVVGDFAWEQGRQRVQVNENLDEFQNKNYSLKVELWRWIEMFVANGAHLVITPSEYLKKIVQSWGVKEDKIRVVYNAVKDIKNLKKQNKSKPDIDIQSPAIISAGRLVPWKGFDILIDAVAEINKNNQKIFLYIAGEGPDEGALKERVQKLGLSSQVKFLGKLNHDKLWECMLSSDIFVLNTAYEGLSHVLIEAMALGIPVVTTSVGGNGELIENNKNGILFDYNNKEQIIKAIKNILNDVDLRDKFVQASQQKSKQFTKDRMLASIDELLREM